MLDELNVKAMEFVADEGELIDKPGYSAVVEGGYVVAIDTQIPPELVEEGMAREVVHRLQTMRRNAGFNIADYIVTYYQTETPLQQVMENFSPYIKQETLSRQLIPGTPEPDTHTEKHRIDGYEVVLGVKRTP